MTRTRVAFGIGTSLSKPTMRGVRKRNRPGSAGTSAKCVRADWRSGDSNTSSGITSFLKRTRICAPDWAVPLGEVSTIQLGSTLRPIGDTAGNGVAVPPGFPGLPQLVAEAANRKPVTTNA